ncbi:MAG: Gx transporter family protein [Firmicutes bacterium]|nr:Gx transporter family protein [Bacillota bacterium]
MTTKKLTYMALLTAVALIIFVIEAQIPSPIPVPGVKLGLANIITVFAMFRLKPKETFLILVCRILLGAVFAGQMMTLLYSFCGGMCCFFLMLLMRRIVTEEQIWVCSVAGAMAHNLGQLAAAMAVVKTFGLIVYLPVLMVSGMLAGAFTGFCAQYLLKHLKKLGTY